MSEKNQEATTCCCGGNGNVGSCSSTKKLCLPVLALAGLALVASKILKRRSR